MNKRANALANRLEEGARALDSFASKLTDAQWNTRVPKDGRKIGVTCIMSPAFTRWRSSWRRLLRVANQ
jgi:hypothetical protein